VRADEVKMGSVSKWTSALVFLLGLARPLFADATLPIVAHDAKAPVTCGDAYAKSLHRVLHAYCQKNRDERYLCAQLLRGFRRCGVNFRFEPNGEVVASVDLPSKVWCKGEWAEATFEGDGRTLRVVDITTSALDECDEE
jgi:hypothetical protein